MLKGFSKGFTLIELMVVIGIIALLVAGGFTAITNAQKTSRDAQRRQHMQAVAVALESYYASAQAYPVGSGANTTAAYANVLTSLGLTSPTAVNSTYPYVYSAATNQYCLCARLEGVGNTSMISGAPAAVNTGTCAAAWSSGTTVYYCVTGGQ
jgi:general secretion pathway protein G